MIKNKIFSAFLMAALVLGGVSEAAAAPQLQEYPEAVETTGTSQEVPDTEDGGTSDEKTKTETDGGTSMKPDGQTETDYEDMDAGAGNEEGKTSAMENSAMLLNGPSARAKTTYYAGYQVRLDGALDTTGALSGLTFTLYEKTSGGEWTEVSDGGVKQSQYSPYYKLSYVYFTYFQIEGTPTNEYKVVLSDNAVYCMPDTIVQLDPNSLAQYGSTIEGNYLDLTKKEVPEDNTEVQVSLGTPGWSGTGTSEDPFTWSVDVDRFTDELKIKTAHSEATIVSQGNRYVGEMAAELPYEESVWDFSVKSADGTKETFYSITVVRAKYKPLAPKDLVTVTPSALGGSDGKIQGLDAGKLYEYRSQEEKDNGEEYHQVPAGSTEIEGLSAGTYHVRFQETWEYEPSYDAVVKVSDPVTHKLDLPEENLPVGVEVLECPQEMVEGHEFTLRFRLPKNSLLDKVTYSYRAGSVIVQSSIPQSQYAYSQEEEGTIVTITCQAFTKDTTLKISLLQGQYFEAAVFTGSGQEVDERGQILLSGDERIQGGIRYFKAGELTATVKVSESWNGYAEITDLKAFRRGTKEEVDGNLTKVSDKEWKLTIDIAEDIDFSYDFLSYPADLTELKAMVEKIGDLEQYVADTARETMETRLALLSAYEELPLKDQSMIDGYITLLEEAYKDLTLRLDLSDDSEVDISVDEKEHPYDGAPWTPKITVSYRGNILTEGTDYQCIYPQDMVSPGEKKITVEFLGYYIGQKTVDVSIIQYFTITASAGEHGSIDPEGTISVREGESQRFIILPDEGYHIQAVYVNGAEVSLTSKNEYVFDEVSEDGTIEAIFAIDVSGEDISDENVTDRPDKDSADTSDEEKTVVSGKAEKSKETKTDSVKTGDPYQTGFYMASLFLGLGVFWKTAAKKKENNRK